MECERATAVFRAVLRQKRLEEVQLCLRVDPPVLHLCLPASCLAIRGLTTGPSCAGYPRAETMRPPGIAEQYKAGRTSTQWSEQTGCFITQLSWSISSIFLRGKLYPLERIAAERDTVSHRY